MDAGKPTPETSDLGVPLGVSLLSRVDPLTVSRLRDVGTPLRVRAGDWLFRAGDDGDALYIVDSGRLEVVSGEGDSARAVRVLGAGDAVGELALLCRAPRAASVRAVRDSALLRVSQDECARLVRAGGSFAEALLSSVGEKLRTSVAEVQPHRAPRVLAVVAIDDVAPAAAIARGLADAIARWGHVAHLTSASAGTEPTWGARLDALERDHDYVVLAEDRPSATNWADFCARQGDRVIAVAGGLPPLGAVQRNHWDLLLCGSATHASARRRWLDLIRPRAHHTVDTRTEEPDIDRLARRVVGRSTGIVLSGGGARGLAHLGVIDVLARAGIAIDRVGGTSMGALVGALFASGRSPAEMYSLCRAEMADRRPFRDFTWPRVSLIRARRAAAMLDRLFSAAHLEDLLLDCFAVSADLSSAEVVVHRRGPVVEAVGASMSLPGLAPPVRIGSRLLVDGGVLNNVPVDVMGAAPEGPVIAVDVMTHAPLGSSGHMPSIVETLARATVIGSHHQAATRLSSASLVIEPEVATFGLLEFARFDEIVEAGRRAARRAIDSGAIARLDPD